VHVTALPQETLERSQLDSVVRGKPECTLTEIAETLAQVGDRGAVAGPSLRRDGGTVHDEDRGFPDSLDELPPPARDLSPTGARRAAVT